MDNYVGKRLDGRYEIQEIIGVGGMAVVYKAYDNIDDRIVAVKILKDEFLANEEFRRRFKNESKAIAILNHPNIVRVYDVNFGERLQYIVMEHVDGITLKEYIQQQGTINWSDSVHFVSQILRALQHAHDKGIVHRDVKPQNIILLQNGNIKVTDFGIARFSRSDTRTMTEKAIGSVHYISPEQARGDMTDEKADIYSVGVVLYEMLTGKVPFESDSAVSVAIMQLQADAVPPTQLNSSIPKGLEQITMHAMQKLSADRYQTATEMLLDVDEISRNPNATFDYSYFVDSQPTKFISNFAETTGEMPAPANMDADYPDSGYYEDEAVYEDPLDEEFENYPDNTTKNKKMIASISVGVLALIAAVVLLVVGLTGGFGKDKVRVPDLLGKDYTLMVEQYKDKFELKATFVDSDLKANSILEQDVKEGAKVAAKSVINVKVAKSGEKVPLPNVTGKTLEDAKKLLAKDNFNSIEIRELASEDVAAGLVISTSPAAGEEIDTSQKITLFISSGSANAETAKLKMPDLSGLTRSSIRTQLEAMGFTNFNFLTEDSTKEKDMYLSQTPKSGTMIAKDGKITITVSSGTKPTTTTKETTTEESTTKSTTTTQPTEKSVMLSFKTYEVKDSNGKYKTYPVIISYQGQEITRNIEMNGNPQIVTLKSTKGGTPTVSIGISELSFTYEVKVDFDKPQENGYPVILTEKSPQGNN